MRLRRLRYFYASAAVRCSEQLGNKCEALSRLWREKQLQYTWLRALQNRHADFRQVTSDALEYALKTLGLEAKGVRERLLEAYRRVDVFPEVRAEHGMDWNTNLTRSYYLTRHNVVFRGTGQGVASC